MGGWIHSLNAEAKKFIPRKVEEPAPTVDAKKVMEQFSADTTDEDVEKFAASLGVTAESLNLLGCQRATVKNLNTLKFKTFIKHPAWAFSMFDGAGNIVGIRLRSDDGSKYAVPGSRGGIFLPSCRPEKTAYIVEGASDSAAILSLGLYGFGKPQASGSIAIISATIARLGIREAIIISDNDAKDKNGIEAGWKGAESLSKELEIPNCVLLPPAKDLRTCLNLGITADLIRSLVSNLVWNPGRKQKPITSNPT